MPQKKSDSLELQEIIDTVLGYLPKFDAEAFEKAYKFAEEAHRNQFRKDESPYITHPLETVKILISLRVDEDTLIAALLHDVPEDTAKTIDDVEKTFGRNVAFLVDGITKLSKVYYRHDMAERQIESLKKLLIHSAKDPRVILIKLADRLHNMHTLQYVREDKRHRIAKETMEVYVPIANLLGIKELKNELEDLCFYHLYPNEYQEIYKKVQKSKIKLKSILDDTIRLIKAELSKQSISAEIYGRHRNLYTIFKKLRASSGKISDIQDVLAIRIVVNKTPQCYKTLGVVHSLFKPKIGLFKDYIAVPKSNGYQSLHTTVFGLMGVSTEFQIRSERMHKEAEYGILSRYLSASKGKVLKLDKDKRAHWVEQVLDIQKAERDSADFMEDLKQDVFEDRIFVFTPRGDSIDLPKGATCIDFAYAIHSDVGHRALEASINDRICPMTTVLNTGDTVKIITSKGKKGPELSWLEFAKTNVAKVRIRAFLGKESRDKKIKRGEKILQIEFDRAGLGSVDGMNFKKIQNFMKDTHKKFFAGADDIFIAVGDGSLRPLNVVNALMPQKKKPFKFYSFLKHPQAGGGKTIHPARVGIQIICNDRIGLVRDVTSVISRFALNIIRLKTTTSKYLKKFIILVYFDVDSFEKLSELLRHIEQVDGVIAILRVFVRRQIWFIMVAALTVLMWIFHPILMKYFLDPNIFSHKIINSVVLYAGFLMLFLAILSIKGVTRRSFPQFREMSFLWVVTTVIFLLAVMIIAFEVYFLKLYTNDWPIVLLLIISVCIYLGTEYYDYLKEKNSK